MIKYKASDLVHKAKQLADLENTDFISWNENITLLNDAYQSVMQRCIDAGEQYNVKTIFTSTGQQIELPEDFYSLRSVSLFNNGILVLVPRHTLSMSYNALSYEIKNNTLFIYGGNSAQIKVDYYTIFPTIGYPNKDVEIEWTPETDYSIFDITSKYVVEFSTAENIYKIYDISTHTNVATYTLQDATQVLIHGDWLCYRTNNIWTAQLINTSTSRSIDGMLVFDASGDLCYTDTDKKLYDINGIQIGQLTNDCPSTQTIAYTNIQKGEEYAYYNGNIVIGDASYSVTQPIRTAINADAIYFTKNATLYKYDFLNNVVSSVQSYSKDIKSIVGLNGQTGYGVAYFYNNIINIYSYVADTLLQLPNNTLWNIIAYKLAVSYKIKQGADATMLSAAYNEMQNTFFDTLKQDMYQPVRINNMYK